MFFIYSCFGICIRILVKKINSSSLDIFDKNFGILFGFIKAMILFSILNIILVLTLWKKNYPKWALDSKSLNIIRYSSSVIIQIMPSSTLIQLEKIFNVENLNSFKNQKIDAEKYGEPQLEYKKNKGKEGYSDNDNESLDKLFNIENND